MESTEQIRIDKWLWAVRVYKTRQLATDACRAGKVNIARVKVKPSRIVKTGDVIIARTHDLRRTVKALAVTDKRIGPKFVETMSAAALATTSGRRDQALSTK